MKLVGKKNGSDSRMAVAFRSICWMDGSCFLINLLDGALNFVTVRIRSCVSDMSMEQIERGSKREADSLRIGTESSD